MRFLRTGITTVMAVGVLLIASPASAQIDDISMGQPRLGLEGASVIIPVTVVCDLGFNVAFGDASVAQSTGHRLAQGTGFFTNDFPGVPCTGTAQTLEVVVPSAGPVAFKQGSAAASASVTVFNPATFDLITETVDSQSVRITKK